MAAVSANVMHHQNNHVKVHESDDDSNDGSCHSREKNEASSPEYKSQSPGPFQGQDCSPEAKQHLQNSPFSMHNVLKMKQEDGGNVFSTEKLLESTPSLSRRSSSQDEDSPRKDDKYRNSSDYESDARRVEDLDENSCCSEDTVLSVGNEAQVSFDNGTSSSQVSPRSSPAPSPASIPPPNHVPGLSSFKHIQSHLSAISQLSQNLHGGQHMLLRPNPIAPSPLLFLNQSRLLFNPHPGIQPESIHPQSLSNSPTGTVPTIPRLSPEISPNRPPLDRSPTSPNEGKLNIIQNLNFGMLGQQQSLSQNLRYYKQIPFGNPMGLHASQAGPLGKDDPIERKGIQKDKNCNAPIVTGDRLFGDKSGNLSPEERHNLILNHNGLKFSIDNILKADFGRRITDPLHKRSKTKHPAQSSKPPAPPEFMGKSAFHPKDSNSFFKDSAAASSSRLSERLSDRDAKSGLQNNVVTSSVSGSASEKPAGSALDLTKLEQPFEDKKDAPMVWPAWVYCTRYSDRPSSGPRTRRPKKAPAEGTPTARDEEKRPRTAFSGPQLARLKHEFAENRYLTERRRQQLSAELGLNEAQIKIWFQNKRAKIKKASGQKNPLALQLMAQGLYNHSTVPLTREEEELQEMHSRESRETKA